MGISNDGEKKYQAFMCMSTTPLNKVRVSGLLIFQGGGDNMILHNKNPTEYS